MKNITRTVLFVIGLMISFTATAAERLIAITIDDLPFVGSTHNKESNLQREHDRFLSIMQMALDRKVPITGFVIAGTIEKDQWQLLELFLKNGFPLGNHTYSHPNLGTMSAEKYIADIDHADKILTPLFNGPKYFRYPYLAESQGKKKQQVYDYLAEHNYVIAPVTIDSKDYNFNTQLFAIAYRQREQNLPQLKKRYLAYIWGQTLRAEERAKKMHRENDAQILLIHANLLNSYCLGDIIDMYEKNGYTIISLDEALRSLAKPKNDATPVLIPLSPYLKQLFSQG